MKMTTVMVLLIVVAPGQGVETNWLEEAQSIGGSGSSADGRYVRLIPSHAWGRGVTPDAWLEMRTRSRRGLVRGQVPVLRGEAKRVSLTLRGELPAGAKLLVSDTYGASSPRVQIRFVSDDAGSVQLARRMRRAFERLLPEGLGRVSGWGTVKKDEFECESFWTVVTPLDGRLVVNDLPAELQRNGTLVEIVAQRRGGGMNEFSYFGACGYWFGVVKLESIEASAVQARQRSHERSGESWVVSCETHARGLLAKGGHLAARIQRPLARGFERITDPGFKVCPECHRALGKSWVFADSTHDRIEATLSSCAKDGLYFLGRDGHDHGPYFPSADEESDR